MLTKLLELEGPVKVEGLSLFSLKKARLTIIPNDAHYWSLLRPEGERVPINVYNVVCAKAQNLAVRTMLGDHAHVLEHLLPLKFLGLRCVQFKSTHSLPYFGRGFEFVSAVHSSNPKISSVSMPVETVKHECLWSYPAERVGREAYTLIRPRSDGKIVLRVTVDYEGLGALTKEYIFPDDEEVVRLSRVRAQGWPMHRYHLSGWANAVGLWRHHDKVEWPQKYTPSAMVLEKFADHRAYDLLGALALLADGRVFSADVESVCSGHRADIEAVRLADACMKQV